MLGGPIIAGETLSRFFSIHVFIIPAMLIAFVGVHLLMVLKLGVNEWPMPGRIVKRSTYLKEYHELTQQGRRAVCAGRLSQRPGVFRGDHSGPGRVRGVVWTVRTEGTSLIPQSCKRCPGRTTFFFGCMPLWRSCRRKWRPFCCWSARFLPLAS